MQGKPTRIISGEYPSGDTTQINTRDIPTYDILCAGFSCQPFSIDNCKVIENIL